MKIRRISLRIPNFYWNSNELYNLFKFFNLMNYCNQWWWSEQISGATPSTLKYSNPAARLPLYFSISTVISLPILNVSGTCITFWTTSVTLHSLKNIFFQIEKVKRKLLDLWLNLYLVQIRQFLYSCCSISEDWHIHFWLWNC